MALGDDDKAAIKALQRRLEEAEETLRAIRSGEVDALVVTGAEGERVYTLQGADHPYRVLIESMQQGAVCLGIDGTVLYCNRRFADMVATPQEKVIGAAAAGFVLAAHRPRFDEMLRQGRGAGGRGELMLEGGEGPPIPTYIVLSPLPLVEADAVCMVVSDLTEQKKHQDLLEVNRRKDEFLAMLAHELRNPLAPIRNALYLMKQGDADRTPAEEVRSMMERQVEHLARLIDDLMDVSRISTGKVELRREEVDLATVVARAVEVSGTLIEQRGHRLSIDLPASPIRLRADPTRLEQILDNLLTNAAKYSDPGGRIALSAQLDGDWAVIRLKDSGIGIEADKLPRIFDLFVQAERRLDRSQGGLGIGLNLVRSLVGMHGGQVWATSEGLGLGSEFIVRLPALPPSLQANSPENVGSLADEDEDLPRWRVLVVDDNVDSARSMALLLGRMWGQEVEVALDGEEALARASSFRPDLVLLDLGLPGLSGYDVAERLRGPGGSVAPMLVAMTGWGNDDDLRRSSAAGFAHHLVKPVDLDRLRALIAEGPPPTPAG
jgi:PAS domain S-box-containing protein